MSRFIVRDTPLAGLKVVTRQRLGDARGYFTRIFCADELTSVGWIRPVIQINHSYTARSGTVRGMHYQRPPHSEIKLVSCLKGEVWDVAVDLRANSPTFLKWHGEVLSAANNQAMLIPEGFAHGFQTLSDDVELIYLHSNAYVAEAEAGLNPQDSTLVIRWPGEICEISARDMSHSSLAADFRGIEL